MRRVICLRGNNMLSALAKYVINTWPFSFCPCHQPSTDIVPLGRYQGLVLITRAIWKRPCINLKYRYCQYYGIKEVNNCMVNTEEHSMTIGGYLILDWNIGVLCHFQQYFSYIVMVSMFVYKKEQGDFKFCLYPREGNFNW